MMLTLRFSSMYPNIIITFNISANCMVGKLILDSTVGDTMSLIENLDEIDEKYDAGSDFIDNLMIDNPANLGEKWFNLPGIVEINNIIKEKLLNKNHKSIKITEEITDKYYIDKLKIKINV